MYKKYLLTNKTYKCCNKAGTVYPNINRGTGTCPRPCVAAKPPCEPRPAACRGPARGKAALCRGKAARGEAAYRPNLVYINVTVQSKLGSSRAMFASDVWIEKIAILSHEDAIYSVDPLSYVDVAVVVD